MSNPNAIYAHGVEPKRPMPWCAHCAKTHLVDEYVEHVKWCIATAIARWNEEDYSKRYFEQVRAMSRFRQTGDPKRRSPFRAWAWWAVPKDDGPALANAEVGTESSDRWRIA